MFSIRSSRSNHELRFSGQAEGFVLVELSCGALQASHAFSCLTGEPGLPSFLSDLAAHAAPWGGERVWKSVESDFSLSATCDAMGHVRLVAEITKYLGASEEWTVSATLVCDLGQLPAIAIAAKRE